MAEFCICGSLVIGGHCTNKNCTEKASRPAQAKAAKSKVASEAKKEPKTTKVRKSSKVITYNLYDTEKEEENVN